MLCLYILVIKFWKTNAKKGQWRELEEASSYAVLRAFSGFVQISLVMVTILFKIKFVTFISLGVMCGLAFVFALLYAVHITTRCVTALLVVQFFGRSGKYLLTTFMFSIVISGVVTNFLTNTGEIVRVFFCTTMVHMSLLKTRFELISAPFLPKFEKAVTVQGQLDEFLNKVYGCVQPMVEEVESTNHTEVITSDTKKGIKPKDPRQMSDEEYALFYANKLENRCQYQIQMTELNCRNNYTHFYLKCVEKAGALASFCSSLDVEKYCNVTEVLHGSDSAGKKHCDSSGIIESKFGKEYREIINFRNELKASMEDGFFQYNITDLRNSTELQALKEKGLAIIRSIKNKKIYVDILSNILTILDVIIITRLIFGSIKYCSNYKYNIDFDNIYVTDELMKMDEEQKNEDQVSVLPLKEDEKKVYYDPMRKKMSRSDWLSIIFPMVWLSLIVIFITMLFILDWLFYQGLDVVRDHALTNYTQKGSFNFTVMVEGKGLISRIIRNATQGFNVSNSVFENKTNFECLPNPVKTETEELILVYVLIALIFYCNFNVIYSRRLRSIICGFFYNDKKVRRVEHLFACMIIQRRVAFEYNMSELLVLLSLENPKKKKKKKKKKKGKKGKKAKKEKEGEKGETKDTEEDKEEPMDDEDEKAKELAKQEKKLQKKKAKALKHKFDPLSVKLKRYTRNKKKELKKKYLWIEPLRCPVCHEQEIIKKTGVFLQCGKKNCKFRYCASCLRFLNYKCSRFYLKHALPKM